MCYFSIKVIQTSVRGACILRPEILPTSRVCTVGYLPRGLRKRGIPSIDPTNQSQPFRRIVKVKVGDMKKAPVADSCTTLKLSLILVVDGELTTFCVLRVCVCLCVFLPILWCNMTNI